MSSVLYIIDINRKHRNHSPVAIITVMTSDWPSYSCSASHRRHPKITRKHPTVFSDDQNMICHEDDETKDIIVWTNMVTVLAMRLLVLKILVFNTLMTTYAVIKW
ncbi:hypothetical protein PAMP_022408 [Pampus punctatissimus]